MIEVTNPQEGFYRISLRGKGTFDEFFSAIGESQTFADSTKELWNLVEIPFELNTEQIRLLATAAQMKRHKPVLTAIVATGDLHFGLLRMYSVYREDGDTELAVFRSDTEAMEWLGIQGIRDAGT